MSPSWRDRWVVRLGEDAVSAARYAAGWRLGEPRRATAACVAGSGVDGVMMALEQVLAELAPAGAALRGTPALSGAARRLDGPAEGVAGVGASQPSAARGATWRGRMPVHVVVSNRLVRYALAPGLGSLRRPAERRLAAESALSSLYGEPAEPWSAVLGEAPGNGDAVAAGMPQAFVAGTLERCEAAGLDVVSFEPLLAASFGALQRAMAEPVLVAERPGAQGSAGASSHDGKAMPPVHDRPAGTSFATDTGWIALAEPDHLLVARLEGGRLTLLRNQRLRGPVEQELPVWLDRLTVAQGLPAGPAPVVVASAQALPRLEGRSASYGYRFVAIAPEGRLPGGAAA